MGQPFTGNWNKERVFSREFLSLPLGTYIVVLDLDILVTGSLDFLLADNLDENLVMAPDGWPKRKGLGHGSVYRLKAGKLPHIWENLLAADHDALRAKFGGEREQSWLDGYFNSDKIGLFPSDRVVSYKFHCDAEGSRPFGWRASKWGFTNAHWAKARLPPDARIVCFHGRPDLEDVAHKNYRQWKHAPFIQETLNLIRMPVT